VHRGDGIEGVAIATGALQNVMRHISPECFADVQLAWQMWISSSDPLAAFFVLIDAKTGELNRVGLGKRS
jgi:hypothetical protein